MLIGRATKTGKSNLSNCLILWKRSEYAPINANQSDSHVSRINRGGFPDSSVGKESTCNAGDPGLIPGLDRSTGEGIGYLLQYSWASLVAQLAKNLPATWETWFNPWVGKIPWRRERLPTLVFWLGEFHGLYSPWVTKSRAQLRLSLSLSNLL